MDGFSRLDILYYDDRTIINKATKVDEQFIAIIVYKMLNIRDEDGLIITRSPASYIRQIRTIKRLYKANILKTDKCVLKEQIGGLEELIYKIFGR